MTRSFTSLRCVQDDKGVDSAVRCPQWDCLRSGLGHAAQNDLLFQRNTQYAQRITHNEFRVMVIFRLKKRILIALRRFLGIISKKQNIEDSSQHKIGGRKQVKSKF